MKLNSHFGPRVLFKAKADDGGAAIADEPVEADTPTNEDEQPDEEIEIVDEQTQETGVDDVPPDDEDAGDEASSSGKSEEGDELDAALLQRAKALNFTDDEIQELGKSKQLERVLVAFDRKLAVLGTEPEPVAATAKPQTTKEAEKPKDDEEVFDLKEDDYDPATYKVLKSFHEQNQRLKSEITEVRKIISDHQAKALDDEFDRVVDTLGAKYTSILGKGTGDKLTPDSKEFQARSKLYDQVRSMALGMKKAKLEIPEFPELVQRAARALFGTDVEGQVKKDISNTLQKNKQQLLVRPTQRKAVVPDPKARAMAAVRAKLRG